ncbi:MAG: cobalamin biosynthesis protein CobD [Candidatus Omnitrophica bacterium]|nr:cobalamin biosynthesis protein CobD [Candidatus Omnitrophota bacterium]
MDPVSVKIAAAYAADLTVGDPRWLPHPVRGLGWMIRHGEAFLRRHLKQERLAGGVLAAGVCGAVLLISTGAIWAAGRFHPLAAGVVEIGLLFFCFSTKDLAVESWPVYGALKAGNLVTARKKVSWIVGRDTKNLSEPEVVRATLETVAESTMDGVVAPLFYAAVGGAPLACLYKAVNTLDSMVGFRSVRYLRLGWAAATLDRWMNCIPAHLTVWFLALAAQLRSGTGWQTLRIAYRDGWPSRENSYLTEAAMAGALRIRLGGENQYQGVPVPMPLMGDARRPLTAERIPESLRVMWFSSFLTLSVLILARWVWSLLWPA